MAEFIDGAKQTKNTSTVKGTVDEESGKLPHPITEASVRAHTHALATVSISSVKVTKPTTMKATK